MKYHQFFDENKNGRDFVIGDLHGHIKQLMELLEFVNFSSVNDRLFSVGDLIDRGPEPVECLDLMFKPWFHTVLANHEEAFLESVTNYQMRENRMRWGDLWSHWYLKHNLITKRDGVFYTDPGNYHLLHMVDILNKLASLPYCITVKCNGKLNHIIHAEFSKSVLEAQISDEDLMKNDWVTNQILLSGQDGFSKGVAVHWNRKIFELYHCRDLKTDRKLQRAVKLTPKIYREGFNNLSRVISGHTIMNQPLQIVKQLNIDTGSFLRDKEHGLGLTIMCLNTEQFFTNTVFGIKEVEKIELRKEDMLNN